MAKKKTPASPKNDFAAEEELDICGFSNNLILTGECIASFSFGDDSTDENHESTLNLSNTSNVTSESASTETIDFNNTTNVHFNSNSNSNVNNNDDINSNTSSTLTPGVKTLSNNKDILTDN